MFPDPLCDLGLGFLGNKQRSDSVMSAFPSCSEGLVVLFLCKQKGRSPGTSRWAGWAELGSQFLSPLKCPMVHSFQPYFVFCLSCIHQLGKYINFLKIFLLFSFILILLERQAERTEIFYLLESPHAQNQAKAKNLELPLSLPYEKQGPKHLEHCLLPAGCTSRKLDWK